jgi:hypothetical protein
MSKPSSPDEGILATWNCIQINVSMVRNNSTTDHDLHHSNRTVHLRTLIEEAVTQVLLPLQLKIFIAARTIKLFSRYIRFGHYWREVKFQLDYFV